MPKIFGKFLVIFTITAMSTSTILSISTVISVFRAKKPRLAARP